MAVLHAVLRSRGAPLYNDVVGFAPGDRVHLAGLGSGVVIEARGRARYAVEIKGRVVVANERDLEPAAQPPMRGRKHERPAAEADAAPPRGAQLAPSLDLHGRTTVEAIELVGAFVNEAVLAGHGQVVIIHGRSGGRLKSAVQALLRDLAAVARFRLDPRNPGATIVILR